MIACVAILCSLASPIANETHGESIFHRVAGNTPGGGGAGGAAYGGATVNCNVPGSCVVGPATGGNGGNGGNANVTGGKPPIVGMLEEPPIRSTISSCSLEIAGKKEIEASGCDFERTASNKKSVLTARSINRKYRYIVTWLPSGNGSAEAYLQGGRSEAVRSLGTVYKNGACWTKSDSSVKFCAWK